MIRIFEVLKNVTTIIGCFVGICSGIIFFCKPLKKRFFDIINKNVDTDKQNETLIKLGDQLEKIIEMQDRKYEDLNNRMTEIEVFIKKYIEGNDELLKLHTEIHILTLENRMTNTFFKYLDQDSIPLHEKKNFIRHYDLYKSFPNVNGNMDQMNKEIRKMHVAPEQYSG